MKRLLWTLAIVAICLPAAANATVLLTEEFEYDAGTLLTATPNWAAHSGAGTNPLTVTASGLSYPGYPPTLGNAVAMTVSGEDVHTLASMSHTDGAIYLAFVAEFSAAQGTGDYFAHFYQSSSSFYGRVYAKDSGGALNFGVSRGSAGPNYSPDPFAYNTPHLIVVKYTMIAGTLNDTADLWVNPVIGPTEPAPLVSYTDVGSTDGTNIIGVALRQGNSSNAPTQWVDGIRVATTWADAVGAVGDPLGACCDPDGGCTITYQVDCFDTWHAEWTSCEPNPCPQPPIGACCFADGSCEFLLDTDCAAQGGTFQGTGVACDPNPCPQPGTGACCFDTGACTVLTGDECAAQEGAYQGDGSTCSPNPCPQPATGACCFESGLCVVATEHDCLTQGGLFQGADTSCTPNPCPFPVKTLCELAEDDVNGIPVLNGQRVQVEGVAHVPNGIWSGTTTQFEISDGSCCVSVFGGSIVPVAIGDRVLVRGTVMHYNGLTEISSPDLEVTVLSGGHPVYGPTPVTTGELGLNGEQYEACFISIQCATIVSGTWPTSNQNANLTIDDGSGPVTLRIDRDTDIDGSPAPTGPINIVGVAYQFDGSSPYTEGYQILPRSLEDITPCVVSQPGACCFSDGSCQYLLETDCATAGGSWLGALVPCDPNPCPQPVYACCFATGECDLLTAEACTGAGGTPQPGITSCTPNPCPQPFGACCFPDGSCQFILEAECTTGIWLMMLPCDPNPCPEPPPGACCFADGSCQVLSPSECLEAGGAFEGPGVACDPNPCDQPPPEGACCFPDGTCQYLTQENCEGGGGAWVGEGAPCDPNPCPPPVPVEKTSWGRVKSQYR